MASPADSVKEVAAAAAAASASEASAEAKEKETRKGGGILWRIWRALSGGRGEGYETRLQYLSKEEAAVHARMRRRMQFSRRSVRNLIVLSVLGEKYDLDPAAKAAVASVLAYKLGAESGLKVYVGDESESGSAQARSSDIEVVPSNGLRNRKQTNAKGSSSGSAAVAHTGN